LDRKKYRGTKLKVFSGREAALNFIIFLILDPEGKLLASYDIYREVHATKGFRRKGKQNVNRRVKALFRQGWLETEGTRETKPHFLSPLYKLSEKGRAALELRRDLNLFLETAPKDQLKKVVDAFKMYR
jgi:DNA-binding PadR family transcriptional regulator